MNDGSRNEHETLSVMLVELLYIYHHPLITARKPVARALELAIHLLDTEMQAPESLPKPRTARRNA